MGKTPKAEKFSEKMRREAQEAMKKFVTNLPTNINSKMEAALLSLLGLEKRNGYEIDHCNGRNSVLIDVIRGMAVADVEKAVKGIQFKSEETSLIREALKKEYKSQLSYVIRDLATRKAREDAERFIAENLAYDFKAIDELMSETK